MNDRELRKRILANDKHAASLFYKMYVPRLARYIQLKVHDFRDAEEIVQDTLYAFLEALRDFEEKSSLRTFLFSIGNHKIIDYYRKKKLKQVFFSQVPQLESLVSPLLNPEEELDTHLVKQKIGSVLDRLLPHYKQALVYKYMDNMSVEAIADKLSLSLKSVESILFRARRAFVEAFVSI